MQPTENRSSGPGGFQPTHWNVCIETLRFSWQFLSNPSPIIIYFCHSLIPLLLHTPTQILLELFNCSCLTRAVKSRARRAFGNVFKQIHFKVALRGRRQIFGANVTRAAFLAPIHLCRLGDVSSSALCKKQRHGKHKSSKETQVYIVSSSLMACHFKSFPQKTSVQWKKVIKPKQSISKTALWINEKISYGMFKGRFPEKKCCFFGILSK